MMKKLIGAGVAVFLAVVLLISSIHIVPAGHRGIVKIFGNVQDAPLYEGLHFLNPIASVVDFNVRFQSATATHAEGGTSDLQEVFEDITLNYSFDAQHAPYVYNNFGDDESIETKFIVPALYESFKAVTSNYTAEQLVTERSKVSAAVIVALQGKLSKYKIIVSDINIKNFAFDPQFAEAVRRKVVAGQNRLTAEQTLETAKISTEQKVVEAEGNAKAIAIQASAIEQAGGDKYIGMKWIERWNGVMPLQYSGTPIPYMNLATGK